MISAILEPRMAAAQQNCFRCLGGAVCTLACSTTNRPTVRTVLTTARSQKYVDKILVIISIMHRASRSKRCTTPPWFTVLIDGLFQLLQLLDLAVIGAPFTQVVIIIERTDVFIPNRPLHRGDQLSCRATKGVSLECSAQLRPRRCREQSPGR